MRGSWVTTSDGAAVGVQFGQQFHDTLPAGGIEIAGRLVGQHQAWLVDQRTGNGDALLLAAGELGRLVLPPVGQADALQQGEGTLLALAARDAGKAHRESRHSPRR